MASARRFVVAHKAEALAACFLVLMAANLFTTIARKTITTDEIVLIPAAYYHLVAGNFQPVHEHPPLSKLLAGLPLLFIQPDEVKPQAVASATTAAERNWAHVDHFWNDNRARFFTIAFWARVPAALLTLALGVGIFLFARELFGPRAAVLAVFLYSFEPTFLAHGRVVQTDVPATLGYMLVCFALHRYLKVMTSQRALWVGAAAGLALLGKFSMIIVGPSLLAVFLILVWRRRVDRRTLAIHAALAVLASLVMVNAAYYFDSRPLTDADVQWVNTAFPKSANGVWLSVSWLKHLLPTDFVLGVYWQLRHSLNGHPAALLGMHSMRGWWYYFPVAFALKTTLPFLILSIASIAWSGYKVCVKRNRVFLIMLVPFLLYTIFVMTSPINIGVRYFLPAFPFLLILAGALLDQLLQLKRARRAGQVVVALLICWVGIEAVRAYPHQISYMNQLAWQHPHWHYLSDSNIEWGDDVGELGTYLRTRGETRVRATLLGGWSTLRYYGVDYLEAMQLSDPLNVETRYVAVGASFLNGSTVLKSDRLSEHERINFFEAYRRRTPEAIFGGSIYLFRVRE